MTIPEAMTLYIDMIVMILTHNTALPTTSTNTSTPTKYPVPRNQLSSLITSSQKTAMRKIEGLICTNRESLLGSSAWKGDFYDQLKSRPFYTVIEVRLPPSVLSLFVSLCLFVCLSV
jgi:hypothetical protein